jgi:hypothetical protein
MDIGKRIKLEMGGVALTAKHAEIPPSGDIQETPCPHCHVLGQNTLIMDITQHGFEVDAVATILWCTFCGQYFYVDYSIEHDCIDFGD